MKLVKKLITAVVLVAVLALLCSCEEQQESEYDVVYISAVTEEDYTKDVLETACKSKGKSLRMVEIECAVPELLAKLEEAGQDGALLAVVNGFTGDMIPSPENSKAPANILYILETDCSIRRSGVGYVYLGDRLMGYITGRAFGDSAAISLGYMPETQNAATTEYAAGLIQGMLDSTAEKVTFRYWSTGERAEKSHLKLVADSWVTGGTELIVCSGAVYEQLSGTEGLNLLDSDCIYDCRRVILEEAFDKVLGNISSALYGKVEINGKGRSHAAVAQLGAEDSYEKALSAFDYAGLKTIAQTILEGLTSEERLSLLYFG